MSVLVVLVAVLIALVGAVVALFQHGHLASGSAVIAAFTLVSVGIVHGLTLDLAMYGSGTPVEPDFPYGSMALACLTAGATIDVARYWCRRAQSRPCSTA